MKKLSLSVDLFTQELEQRKGVPRNEFGSNGEILKFLTLILEKNEEITPMDLSRFTVDEAALAVSQISYSQNGILEMINLHQTLKELEPFVYDDIL